MTSLTTSVDTATQRFTVTVPVYGTPHRLMYRSDAVRGADPDASVTVPVGRGTLPAGLRRVEVVTSVDGFRERQSLDPDDLPVDIVVSPFRDGESDRGRRVEVAVGYVGEWTEEDPVAETIGRLERRLRGVVDRGDEVGEGDDDDANRETDTADGALHIDDDEVVYWTTTGLTVYRPRPERGFGNWSLVDRAPSRVSLRSRHETEANDDGSVPELYIPAAVEWTATGGRRFEFGATGSHQRTVDTLSETVAFEFETDDEGQLTAIVDSGGRRTSVERDPTGDVTALVASSGARTELIVKDGNLVGVTRPGGESLSFEYTVGGLLTTVTDAVRRRTVVEYDDAGRVVARVRPSEEREEYVRSTTETGYEVRRVGDSFTEELVRVDRLGSGGRTVLRRCCGDSALIVTVDGSTREVSFPDGAELFVGDRTDPEATDEARFAATLRYRTPHGVETVVETDRSVERDDENHIQQVTETVTVDGATYQTDLDATAGQLTTTTPAGRRRVTTLDKQGRRVESQFASLAPVRYEYDEGGQLSSITIGDTDSAVRRFDFEYDATGALVSVADPLGREYEFTVGPTGEVYGEVLPGARTVEYEYDAAGVCTALAPPERPKHRFEWAPNGQLSKYIPPLTDVTAGATDGRTTKTTSDGDRARADGSHEFVYEYDEDGRLVRTVTPDGEIVVKRDTAGRPVAYVFPEDRVTFTYDTAGNLVSAEREETTVTSEWDGPLPRTATWHGTVDGRVTTTYGDGVQVTATQVNDEPALAVDRDEDGLITCVGSLSLEREPETGLLAGARLDAATDYWEHDAFADVRAHTVECNGDVVQAVRYERDELGRVVAVATTVGGVVGNDSTRVAEYEYDEAGRLATVRVDTDVVAAYEYDANGNRTGVETPDGLRTAEYDARDRLVRDGDATFTYTDSGVLRSRTDSDGTTTYDYDLLGNLCAVDLPDGRRIEYVLDGQNRRVAKRIDGKFVAGWLYDGARPVAELDADGHVRTRFVYSANPHSPDYLVHDGRRYRVVADHLGSPVAVVDSETGDLLQARRYDAFGVVEVDSAPDVQPFGFAGGLYDSDTGLVRFGARDYDPSVGRFIAPDPLGFAGGDTNLYAYATGDPVNVTDTTGLYWDTIFDIGSTIYDAANYAKCPSKENAFALVLDGISLILPGVTGLSTVLRNVDDLAKFVAKNPGAREAVERALDWAISKAGKHGSEVGRAMGNFASALRRKLSQADDVVDAGRAADGTVDASKAADDIADAAGTRPPRTNDSTVVSPQRRRMESVPDDGPPVSKTGDTPTVKTSVEGRVVPSDGTAPSFVVDKNGRTFPVPKGASDAVPVESGRGIQYTGGSGGRGLNEDVTSMRIMDSTNSKGELKRGYEDLEDGYVNYFKDLKGSKKGQAVDPFTGKPISKNDPRWHLPKGDSSRPFPTEELGESATSHTRREP